MSPSLPLAAGVHGQSPATLVLLTLGAALTAVVAGLAVAAFVRRRSRPYLLVAMALVSLVARTAVGLAGYAEMVSPELHHQLEHALDIVMSALVIAAVYLVGSSTADNGGHRPARADGGSDAGQHTENQRRPEEVNR
ncbi:MAG: hypothetical protein V5A38_00840 [Halolamina sp.]|uniref:DUF7471 family protein n=1 Tax=Halolamina sp. TaxID=1940283 RepID=UPI002FC3BB76